MATFTSHALITNLDARACDARNPKMQRHQDKAWTKRDRQFNTVRLNTSTLIVDSLKFIPQGHDTTATGAVWILYMLACYPEMQVKVQEEIDSVLGKKNVLAFRPPDSQN